MATKVPEKPSVKIVGAGATKSKKSSVFEEDDPDTIRERKQTRVISRALQRFDKKGISNFIKLAHGVASSVLSAYLGFKDPRKRRREYLIPKDKAAWLEWLVYVAKKRINVEYLTDKELRKVIIRARPNLSPHKKIQSPVEDPDLPSCIDWNEKQVGEWISSIGWPQLRETFVRNMITGRRLVLIDCTALNKMGMTDLASMREVAGKIRELLGTPPPNALRPIVRIAPFERFLLRKVYNGRSYDGLTFEKFCDNEGFNYDLVMDNKNAQIPCTCEVLITTPEQAEADEDGEGEEDDEEHSLKNAPTVEYLVRNAIVRNKTVDQILKDILDNVFLPPRERKYGKEVWGQLKRGIGEGYDDLHLYHPKDRLEFASGVAHHLIDELYKTVGILNDISQLEKHIKEDISPEDMKIFQDAAMVLMEEAAPIASLLALGELDLENIFKKEPTFERYVDDVIREAEKKTNALVPDARDFVDDVIQEAWRKIPDMDLAGLNPELRHSILRMANQILFGITEEKDDIVDTVMSSVGGGGGGKITFGSPSSPKAGGGAKGVKIAPKSQQQQQGVKQKPSQPQPHPSGASEKPSGSPSKVPPETAETVEDAPPSEEHAHHKGTKKHSGTHPHKSETTVSHQVAESKKSLEIGAVPPSTGESGSGSENKDGDAQKQGKGGKGKKHHEKDKDKSKTDEEAPPGAGEGEGVASLVPSEVLQQEQDFTVQTAHIELHGSPSQRLTSGEHSVPPTPLSAKALRLTTADRRDSPLLRSPMTVSTPTGDQGRDSPIPRSPMTLGTAGRLGTRGETRESFADSEGPEIPLQQKAATTVINPAAIHLNRIFAGPVRPTTPYKPKQVLTMSKNQDRQIRPLLEVLQEKGDKDLKKIEDPPAEGQNPRQGKSLPPSQQAYNQQQELLKQQKQRIEQAKQQGEQPRPAAYHQRQGVVTKGEKDTSARKFGSILYPEETLPALHKRVEHPKESTTTPKHEKNTNFVLIPKHLVQQSQQKEQEKLLPASLSTSAIQPPSDMKAQQQKPPQTAPIQKGKVPPIQAATTGAPQSVLESNKKEKQNRAGSTSSNISAGAQQIWEQMKEQYESGKSLEKKGQPSEKRGSKDGGDKGADGANQTSAKHDHEKPQVRKRTFTSGPSELIIDHQHVTEMKEHREHLVEDWAKHHSMMDPLDPNLDKKERTRLVRMTADKVVTEICTMALTHMLLEAEAGKNTQRIMDTLKRLQVNQAQEEAQVTKQGSITLWRASVDGQGGKQVHYTSQQPANVSPPLDTTTTKTAAAAAAPTQEGRQSYQSGGSGKSGPRKFVPQQQQQSKRVSDVAQPTGEKPQLRSILHIGGGGGTDAGTGGADKLKAQAKAVVVNAVKGAYEDTGKSKPLSRSTTAVRKDQYVTRL